MDFFRPLVALGLQAEQEQRALRLVTAVTQITENYLQKELLAKGYQGEVSVLIDGLQVLGFLQGESTVSVLLVYKNGATGQLVGEGRHQESLPGGAKLRLLLQSFDPLKNALQQGEMKAVWLAATSYLLHDGLGIRDLLDRFYPFSNDQLRAYQKRSYHRFCSYQHQLEEAVHRGDCYNTLAAVSGVLNEALRMTFLVEELPYPPDNQLVRVALMTTTGKQVHQAGKELLDYLKEGSLDWPATPHVEDTIDAASAVREVLTAALRSRNVNETWLETALG